MVLSVVNGDATGLLDDGGDCLCNVRSPRGLPVVYKALPTRRAEAEGPHVKNQSIVSEERVKLRALAASWYVSVRAGHWGSSITTPQLSRYSLGDWLDVGHRGDRC